MKGVEGKEVGKEPDRQTKRNQGRVYWSLTLSSCLLHPVRLGQMEKAIQTHRQAGRLHLRDKTGHPFPPSPRQEQGNLEKQGVCV